MSDLKPDEKVCPYCAEVIKAAAVKCRYCQSELTDVPAAPAPAAEPEPAPPPPPPAPVVEESPARGPTTHHHRHPPTSRRRCPSWRVPG